MLGPDEILILALGSLTLAHVGLSYPLSSWSRRRGEVARLAGRDGARSWARVVRHLEALVPEGAKRRAASTLAGSGLAISPGPYVTATMASTGTVFVIALRSAPWWLALVAAGAAGLIPARLVERVRDRRRAEFVDQLPDVARLLSNAASAGRALPSAIHLASIELDAPAREEFALVHADLLVGRSLAESLARVRGRMPSRQLEVMVAALTIQQRVGGDLVRGLREMADTLEERRELIREVQTVMSGAALTGYVVAGAGAVILVALVLWSPDVLREMMGSIQGAAFFGGAVASYTLGLGLIRLRTRIRI